MNNTKEKTPLLTGAVASATVNSTTENEAVSVVQDAVIFTQDAVETYTRCLDLDEAFEEALWFSNASIEENNYLDEWDEEGRLEIKKQSAISALLQKFPDFLSNIDNDYKLEAIQFWNYDFHICTEEERETPDWVRVTYRNDEGVVSQYENASPFAVVRHLTRCCYHEMPRMTDEILEVKVGGNSVTAKNFDELVKIFGIPEEE